MMEEFNPNEKNWEPLFGDQIALRNEASITPPEEPKITCPACGNPNIRAHRLGNHSMEISCSKCGTSLERPIVEDESPLENVVDLVNEYEQIRYRVNKSKEV